MSGGDGIIGDLVQGAMGSRAVEPSHGEGGDRQAEGHACLNCGTALVGSHCHVCGQAAHVHRTLGAFFHDLLHGVFHFEGKIWRTLPLLAWDPGRLTREYIDGRRASYVSPVALFLFSVFLMFATIHAVAGDFKFDPDVAVNVDGQTEKGVATVKGRIGELEKQRAAAAATGKDTQPIDNELDSQRKALDIINEVKASGSSGSGVTSDIPMIDRAIKQFRANPGLVLYKLQTNAYKYSWALIPISVPFVWLLLFPFDRRYHLYDHTVFVTYSLCFMTLLATVLTLAGAVGLPLIGLFAIAIPPWHMYRQLRGTYGLSLGGGLWRTAVLLVIALAAMLLFTLLVLAQAGG